MLHHARKDRPKFRRAQRFSRDIREHLNAFRAKIVHRTVDLLKRGIDIVHRQRSDESRKPVRVSPANFGQSVVGHAGVIRRLHWRRQQLDGWVGKRQYLLIVAKLVEQPEPRLDIPQRTQPGECRGRRKVGHKFFQPVEIRRRHEMIENVDDHRCVPERDENLRAIATSFQAGRCLLGGPLVSNFFSLLTACRGAWPLRSLAASRPINNEARRGDVHASQ